MSMTYNQYSIQLSSNTSIRVTTFDNGTKLVEKVVRFDAITDRELCQIIADFCIDFNGKA